MGVAYDGAVGWCLRASIPNGWFVEEEIRQDFTVRFDCYDGDGVLRQVWETDCRPGYEKFAAPSPIHLQMYQGQALFLDYGGEDRTSAAAIACLDPATGALTRREGNLFLVAGEELFVALCGENEAGRMETVTLRRYRGEALLEEQTIPCKSCPDYLELDRESGMLAGGYDYGGRTELFQVSFLFSANGQGEG